MILLYLMSTWQDYTVELLVIASNGIQRERGLFESIALA